MPSKVVTFCPSCGKPKSLKARTCLGCMPPHGIRPHKWKERSSNKGLGRDHARKLFSLTNCERCGKPGRDRHHKDGDTFNNDKSNVAILCRRCHMIEDGRLERLIAARPVPQPVPPKPCSNCSRIWKQLRKGECAPCYEYRLNNGIARPWVDRKPLATACRRGHALQGENLWVSPGGARRCRACDKLQHQTRKAVRRTENSYVDRYKLL